MSRSSLPTGLVLLCVLAPVWGFLPPLFVGANPFAVFSGEFRFGMLAEPVLLLGSITLFLGRRWGWSLLLLGLLWKSIPAFLDLRVMLTDPVNYEDYLPFAEGFRLGGWIVLFAWLWTPGIQRHTRRD